jgi:hypothetical protein
LKRFKNDWATEEIAKQYFKNKRKNHYNKGLLTVPSKYNYLKQNSEKRSTAASRSKRAKAVLAAKKNARREATRRRKGKGRANAGNDSEAHEEEMEVEVNE